MAKNVELLKSWKLGTELTKNSSLKIKVIRQEGDSSGRAHA
jgi:hypothetical protein